MPHPFPAFLVRSGKLLSAWAVVAAALWLLLESLFFCCIANLFPYAARVSFGFGIYPLLQTSKDAVEPADYIAIFGDSLGFGVGDHFHNTQHEARPAFNVAHHLHDRLQRDVISYAIPASSNLCSWVEDPVASMNYINALWFHQIPQPAEILLYFYEGNDVQDNYRDLQDRYLVNGYLPEKMGDPAYFDSFIRTEMLAKNQINLKAALLRPQDNFMLASYLVNVLDEKRRREEAMAYIRTLKPIQPGTTNQALVNGTTVAMPDSLQAPPIEIASIEVEQSLAFLQAITRHVRQRYAGIPISIIYIPSTISSYRMAGETINIYNPDAQVFFSRKLATEMSNRLCNAVQRMANDNGMGFVDSRPAFLAASQHAFLHGPLDWNHPNQAGYAALADAITTFLQAQDPHSATRVATDCATLQ
jgi:lysophospholipase L1-like esterase